MNILQILFKFQLNLFAIILLAVLFAIIKMKRDIYRFSTFMLGSIIWLTIIALIIEPLSFIFDGSSYFLGIAINYISNYGLVLIAPVLIGMWASYLDYKIFRDRKRIYKLFFYQQGSLIILVLCIINLFTPVFFSITTDHIYSSGPLQWIGYIFVYSYYLYIVVIAYLNRKRISNSVIYGIIAFFTLPLIGSMMQMFNSNLFFAWTMLALATIVVYIFLETTSGIRDYLTKLYSRHTFENYLTHLIESNSIFGVVMFDLNSFKKVNDVFGHQIGDMVLIRFSEILKETFKEEKMVARLGGDEFYLAFEKLNQNRIVELVQEMKKKVSLDPLLQQYNLPGFSWGISSSKENKTIDDLFLAADRQMYRNKPDFLVNKK